MTRALYYCGRLAQLIGMWLLLVDLFMAGPMGPDPKPFAAGALVRKVRELLDAAEE